MTTYTPADLAALAASNPRVYGAAYRDYIGSPATTPAPAADAATGRTGAGTGTVQIARRRPTARAPRHKPGVMNRTEEAYAAVLETRRIAGEVHAYWFEGLTLKIGVDCRVTLDFLVQLADGTLELHDAKGGKVNAAGKIVAANMRDDAHAKYAVAAKQFPFPIRVACGVAGTKTRAWQWGVTQVGREASE